jgi:hypothetical protein
MWAWVRESKGQRWEIRRLDFPPHNCRVVTFPYREIKKPTLGAERNLV